MDTKQRSGSAPARRRKPASPGKSRTRTAVSRKPRQAAPAVNYTPPKPVNRTLILLGLATAVAMVASFMFAVSIFFKVETVNVSGAERYTAWEVREASGIRDGESLMTLSKAKVAGNIRSMLPYVKSVRVGKALPDTINIEIVEEEVSYSVEANGGGWWLISASGRVLEKIDRTEASRHTVIKGVQLEDPAVGMEARAAEIATEPQASTDEESTEVTTAPVTVTASGRLNTVLWILQCLEENHIIGGVVSVDVTDMGNIELWYGDQYQVKLGNQDRIDEKIYSMAAAIDQLAEYQSGEIDVSFTVWPNEVGYTPFS